MVFIRKPEETQDGNNDFGLKSMKFLYLTFLLKLLIKTFPFLFKDDEKDEHTSKKRKVEPGEPTKKKK